MGGIDLGELHRQLQDQQARERQLRKDVQELAGDYPGFMFHVIAKPGEAAIEAIPRPGNSDGLYAVIMPDADGIRAALTAEGVCPVAADDAALNEP
jgi:hypothetical protein